MARPRKFKKEIVAEALQNSGGIYTIAAQLIEVATKQSCSANTIKNYVEAYPDLARLKDEIEQENFDIAVHGLLSEIRAKNLTAIIYYINRKGAQFGWSNKLEIDATIRTEPNAQHLENLEKLNIDDQRQVLEIIQRARKQQEADGDSS